MRCNNVGGKIDIFVTTAWRFGPNTALTQPQRASDELHHRFFPRSRPPYCLEMSRYYSQTPPPLMHPVPTHPVSLPEPPGTPGYAHSSLSSFPTHKCTDRSPGGYQRFTSSSPSQNTPLPHQQGYGQNFAQAYPFQPQQQAPLQHQGHMGQMGGPPRAGGIGTPDFVAWGMDGPTAQFGMQLGQSAVAAGQDYVQKNVCPLLLFSSMTGMLMGGLVRWLHTLLHTKAPLQRIQSLRRTKNSSCLVSVET